MALQEVKKKKIKVPKVVNGIDTLVEIEVEDTGGPVWGPKDAHTILNHDILRLDGPAKVNGKAKYSYDVRLPGMLYGQMLRPPFPSAEIVRIDTSAAEKINGVKVVIVADAGGKPKTEVKHEGDWVAAVAAITPEIAEDALHAIKVEYKKRPHAVKPRQAIREGAPRVFDNLESNLRKGGTTGDAGEVEAALEKCDAVVEHEFLSLFQHHLCLETHGVVVDYRGGDTATVYASTQHTFSVNDEAAKELGLKGAEAVTSVVEYMGGGFGSKFGLDLPGMIACRLSKKAQAPVKMMLTRTDEFLAAGNRSGFWIKAKAGATKDGKLMALHALQRRLGGVGGGSQPGLPYVYRAEKVYRETAALHTNHDGSRAMRAPGHPQASFAMEAIMDDLAYAIGMDPIEFRKKNLPVREADQAAYVRQLDAGAKAIGWERRPQKPGGGEAYGPYKSLKRGFGCGIATWGGGGGPTCKVDVFIQLDGGVVVQVGTQDLGTGTRSYTAGIVAEEFGLPVSAVQERIGRSTYGMANGSGGSTTVASLAPAVKDAAFNARIQLFEKVAAALSVPSADLIAKDGKIASTKDPSKSLTWKQACATLGMGGVSARGEWKPGLSGAGVHGAYFAEVEVDTDTGQVRVLKMVGVQDCGLCLNRKATESQINGGMIQALGYALTEEHVTDAETGNMMNPNMDDYKLPGCFEMPELVPIIDDGDTREVVIGMAEPAIIPGHSAIANAIHSACGVRITSLPITPDKVLNGLEELRKG
jgi:xanthine dehydrogenase YagR molybdenum-binding subunit